jgi:hypothetical protein
MYTRFPDLNLVRRDSDGVPVWPRRAARPSDNDGYMAWVAAGNTATTSSEPVSPSTPISTQSPE